MTLLVLKFILFRACSEGHRRIDAIFAIQYAPPSIASRMQRFQAYTLLAPYYMYKRMLMLLRPPSHLLIPTQPHLHPRPGPHNSERAALVRVSTFFTSASAPSEFRSFLTTHSLLDAPTVAFAFPFFTFTFNKSSSEAP